MTAINDVLLVLGAALVGFSGWERLGRSRNARAWVRSPGARATRNHLFLYPSLGVLLLVLGAFPLVDSSGWVAIPLALVAVAALVILFWCGILALPYPRSWVPRWAREQVGRRPQDV